jgi:hypothetical protein
MSGMPPKADLFRQNVWIAPNIGLFSPPMKTGILCHNRKNRDEALGRESIALTPSACVDDLDYLPSRSLYMFGRQS